MSSIAALHDTHDYYSDGTDIFNALVDAAPNYYK